LSNVPSPPIDGTSSEQPQEIKQSLSDRQTSTASASSAEGEEKQVGQTQG
jgi:hypothetical protein